MATSGCRLCVNLDTLLMKQWALNKAMQMILPIHTWYLNAESSKPHMKDSSVSGSQLNVGQLSTPLGTNQSAVYLPHGCAYIKWGSLSCPVVYCFVEFIDENLCLFLFFSSFQVVGPVMCANLLMRLAHISICLMNCYRIHSFPFLFPYSYSHSHSHSYSLIHLPSSLLGHLTTFVFWLACGGRLKPKVLAWFRKWVNGQPN